MVDPFGTCRNVIGTCRNLRLHAVWHRMAGKRPAEGGSFSELEVGSGGRHLGPKSVIGFVCTTVERNAKERKEKLLVV